MYLFLVFFILFLIWKLINSLPLSFPKFKLQPSRLDIVYGGCGSGKTTYAAYLTRKALASGVPVYSNVPITGAYQLSKSDIGYFSISGLVIFDEVGIEYNNRDFSINFKGGSPALEWFKKHRHEGCQVLILSQGFDDMDKKLQVLGSHYWIARHSLIPGFITLRQIRKRPQIDDKTHSPVDYYDWMPFSKKRIMMRPLWKYFDSFDKMLLPTKVWEVYGHNEEDPII